MKIIMVPVLVAVLGATGASEMGLLHGHWPEVFPQDAVKRMALSRCETQTGAFDRFDGSARDACYRRALGSEFTGPPHTAPAPNQLDLRAAAARGTVAFTNR